MPLVTRRTNLTASTTESRSSPAASLPSSKYRKLTLGMSRGSAERSVTSPARLLVCPLTMVQLR